MDLSGHWEQQAEAWARWARAPGHDAYWDFSGPRFRELLPPPGRRTLDLGCGEGRLARDLSAEGHRVVGVDASPTAVRLAAEADPDGDYVLADAGALPFDDGSFDVVVAFNSLMDLDDLEGALRETARVLEPGGRLCACIVHPLQSAGRFSETEDGRFEVADYLGPHETDEVLEQGGMAMHFRSLHRPLERYSAALEDAGFLIEALREPAAPDRPDHSRARWRRIPMFLLLRAVKARPTGPTTPA